MSAFFTLRFYSSNSQYELYLHASLSVFQLILRLPALYFAPLSKFLSPVILLLLIFSDFVLSTEHELSRSRDGSSLKPIEYSC